MSRLPGCVFVEESGEALLSRLASACRRQPHIIDFTGTLHLWLTLDIGSAESRRTRGALRVGLAEAVRRNVQSLVAAPEGRAIPVARDASTVSWRPVTDEVVWQLPGVVPISTEESSYAALLSGPNLF